MQVRVHIALTFFLILDTNDDYDSVNANGAISLASFHRSRRGRGVHGPVVGAERGRKERKVVMSTRMTGMGTKRVSKSRRK